MGWDVESLEEALETAREELRAARAEIERLRTAAAEPAEDTPDEGRTVADDGRIRVVEHARNGETVAHVYVLGVRVNVTCRGQAVWIANALAPVLEAATRPADDERADVVVYMSRVAANLRRQRPRTDYLDTEADTYERASDAIADECHVGAAKGGERG